MKRTRVHSVSEGQGFTLVEVLIALALAAIGFGVVLNGVGLQMTLVATSVEKHQMLMYASEAMENAMSRGTLGDEEVEESINHFSRSKSEREEEGLEQAEFLYSISTQPVTADPRVQQVTVQVRGDRGLVRLAAYRLRVKREEKDDSDDDSSSTNSAAPVDNNTTPTNGGTNP